MAHKPSWSSSFEVSAYYKVIDSLQVGAWSWAQLDIILLINAYAHGYVRCTSLPTYDRLVGRYLVYMYIGGIHTLGTVQLLFPPHPFWYHIIELLQAP